MELMQWLTDTMAGEFTLTVLVSMIPVVELRGGNPFRRSRRPAGVGGLHRRGDRQPDPRPLHHRLHPAHLPVDAPENPPAEQPG